MGGADTWSCKKSSGFFASNGKSPVSISYKITASEYTSDAGVSVRPCACSGLINSGVPNTIPSRVSCTDPGCISRYVTLAKPKSSTLGKSARPPCLHKKTFSGLRSRCTIPATCASSSAPQTCIMMRSARRSSMGPSARTTRLIVLPSSSSITMNSVPSSSASYINTRAVCGCVRWLMARASRLNLEAMSLRSASLGCNTLTATMRFMSGCSALYTAPMPPMPIFWTILN